LYPVGVVPVVGAFHVRATDPLPGVAVRLVGGLSITGGAGGAPSDVMTTGAEPPL